MWIKTSSVSWNFVFSNSGLQRCEWSQFPFRLQKDFVSILCLFLSPGLSIHGRFLLAPIKRQFSSDLLPFILLIFILQVMYVFLELNSYRVKEKVNPRINAGAGFYSTELTTDGSETPAMAAEGAEQRGDLWWKAPHEGLQTINAVF